MGDSGLRKDAVPGRLPVQRFEQSAAASLATRLRKLSGKRAGREWRFDICHVTAGPWALSEGGFADDDGSQ
jgi:hypothetical protein